MFKKKSYVYHVVYQYKIFQVSGHGSMIIYKNHKIKTIEHVAALKKFIEKHQKFDSVIIQNWIRLKNEYQPINTNDVD